MSFQRARTFRNDRLNSLLSAVSLRRAGAAAWLALLFHPRCLNLRNLLWSAIRAARTNQPRRGTRLASVLGARAPAHSTHKSQVSEEALFHKHEPAPLRALRTVQGGRRRERALPFLRGLILMERGTRSND